MAKQERSKAGKFTSKSDEDREVRSLRCTAATWQKLGELAELQGITRADLIEQWTTALEKPVSSSGLDQIDKAIAHVLNDPAVTRNGKDRGSVRRALEAVRNFLASSV